MVVIFHFAGVGILFSHLTLRFRADLKRCDTVGFWGPAVNVGGIDPLA
jgi:hypothetical protein